MAIPPSPFLKTCVTKIDVDSGQSTRFLYGVANCQGWRNTQEDAHVVLPMLQPNTSLFAIFDGHNGFEVARFIAKHLPKYLLKNNNYCQGNIERGLQEAFMAIDEVLLTKDANDILLNYREKSPNDIDRAKLNNTENPISKYPLSYFTGCTAVVMLIKNDIYYCANIGDSRCLLCRDGKPRQLSKDHKPDDPEEKARVEKAGGSVVNGRINMGIDVSRSFGDHWYKQNAKLNSKEQMMTAWPFTSVDHMTKSDQFLALYCDGIWNAISSQDLVSFIQKRIMKDMPLSKICEEVIKHILPSTVMPKTGIAGKDNMTIMIIKLVGCFSTTTTTDPSNQPKTAVTFSSLSNKKRTSLSSNNNGKSVGRGSSKSKKSNDEQWRRVRSSISKNVSTYRSTCASKSFKSSSDRPRRRQNANK